MGKDFFMMLLLIVLGLIIGKQISVVIKKQGVAIQA
jgi:hypothetical protein